MSTAPAKNRRTLGPYAGLAVLTLGVCAGLFVAGRVSRLLFERPGRAPTSAAPLADHAAAGGADASTIFQVVMAEGGVDAFRDGEWLAIRRGDRLTLQDLVRTAAGARAVLRLGASTEIELREKVEIRLDRLSGTGASVDLRRGKVVAHVVRAGDNLAITASETRTSNDGAAHFIVMAGDSGRVSVAATRGTARFASGGRQVVVPQGSETFSEGGAAPAEPERIPEDVLLSVIWPEAERHAAQVPVQGKVRPSSLVTVNGVPIAVDASGRFVAAVPLEQGANDVKVEAEDLSGRRQTRTTTLVRQAARRPPLTAVPGKLWNDE
jgi:hypothetical protein